MNKKIVGLTGGIASGKSAAAEMFESAGAYIIDRAAFGVVMIVAPLLYESGLDKLASVVITVSCSESERIKRLTARDSINETLARKMISSQMSDAERENRADIVIRNGGSLAELRAQVIRIYCELTDKSGR